MTSILVLGGNFGGLTRRVPITWVTPEPALGHFGIGGIRGGETMLKAFLRWLGIDYRVNAAIREVTEDAVILDTGERLPATWKMLVPPFKGARVIRESPGLGDEKGFIVTDDGYRHLKYPEIFAAGLAVRVANPFVGAVPFGVPKTGYPTDEMVKAAVENIRPRKFAMMLPNVFGDFLKVGVEKMLMLKYRHGWSFLPQAGRQVGG